MTSEDPYPPAHPPADGDRTSQVSPPPGQVRFSASASVPVPTGQSPVAPPYGGGSGSPAAPHDPGYGQPAAPTSSPFGQPGASGAGTLGPPPGGHGRVSASASAPVPPSAAATAGSYQSQVTAGGAGAAPATSSGYGAPPQNYPDYPAPPATQGYPTQPVTYGQPSGSQHGGYGSGHSGGQGGFGQPGPGLMGQPGGYPQPGYPPGTDPTRIGPAMPTVGWAPPGQPSPDRRRRGVLIALIVVAALIVVGGVGGIAWALANRGTPYQVGVCVQQDGTSAQIVDCGTSGAYRITSIVATESQCPDPAKPVLILTGAGKEREVACLTEAT